MVAEVTGYATLSGQRPNGEGKTRRTTETREEHVQDEGAGLNGPRQALEKMAERHKGDQRIRDWANGLRYFRILCSTGEPGKSLSPPHLPAGIHAAAWQKLNKPGIALQVARDHLAQNPRDLFATALYCSTGFETGNQICPRK